MRITNNNSDCGVMHINLHNVCNFKCSYCDPMYYSGDNRWPNSWDGYLDLIDDMKERNKYLLVSIAGGEPTLMPKFDKFIEYISSENTFVEIATNGSRTLSYWNKFPKSNILIGFSWHSEFIDDEHYMNVIEIMGGKAQCQALIMVTPDNYKRARKLCKEIEKRKLKVHVIPKMTRTNYTGSTYFDYTDEMIKWITKDNRYNQQNKIQMNWEMPHKIFIDGQLASYNNLAADDKLRFKGWNCYAGSRLVCVKFDGTIEACSSGGAKYLGNVNTHWELLDKPLTCDIKDCLCKLDVMIEKWI